MNSRSTGFTLIELMIVVAIIAILAAIAYPSYVSYVEKARRSDVQSDLVELANFLERNYSNSGSYDKDAAGNAIDTDALPFKVSPRDAAPGSSSAYYKIELNADSQSWTLTATPQNAQSNDSCGTLTLESTGKQTPDDCWPS